MRVATLEVDFHVPASRSLKEKRKVVKSLRDRIRARFPVAVAEVDHQELHARAMLGVAAVGSNGGIVERMIDEVARTIESDLRIVVIDVVRDSY